MKRGPCDLKIKEMNDRIWRINQELELSKRDRANRTSRSRSRRRGPMDEEVVRAPSMTSSQREIKEKTEREKKREEKK